MVQEKNTQDKNSLCFNAEMFKGKKFVKVMFDTKSGASDLNYKIDEINVAQLWNPKEIEGGKMGGFNFSTETKIIRWLLRGDTLYDVELPNDTEIVEVFEPSGVYRSNKIIVRNPRKIDDSMAMELYKISDLDELAYLRTIAGCAIRGYKQTAIQIIKDKVNRDNIDTAIFEYDRYLEVGKERGTGSRECAAEIYEVLIKLKSSN